MATNRNRVILTGIGILVIAVALLFGGAGVTAYAAQSSLPGDALYGVKTTLEQTRLTMASDASMRANLYMEFAETRLSEISKLISEQRYQDISRAAADFETYANKAIAELEVVAQGNPEQAAVLTAKISEALSRYARTLTSMLDSVPEPVKAQLQQVITSSAQNQSSPAVQQQTEVEFSGVVETIVEGAWIIAGKTVFIHTQTEIKDDIQVGDFVKVHAIRNSAGDLVAREVELDNDRDANSNDDNSNDDNGNDNDNANSNDNGNSNANSNDDDNMNANDNDDNGNANSNDNDDDDDDGNSNNSNDDDSNSNDDNSNDDGNSNDDYSDDDNGNSNDDSGNGNDNRDDDDDKGNDNGDDD